MGGVGVGGVELEGLGSGEVKSGGGLGSLE